MTDSTIMAMSHSIEYLSNKSCCICFAKVSSRDNTIKQFATRAEFCDDVKVSGSFAHIVQFDDIRMIQRL